VYNVIVMTNKQAQKILDDPAAHIEKQIRAYRKIHPPWDLDKTMAFCQLALSRLDPFSDNYNHYSLQMVKEIRNIATAIEDKGKADKIEIHNHIHKPK
jgi:hypothetical protein